MEHTDTDHARKSMSYNLNKRNAREINKLLYIKFFYLLFSILLKICKILLYRIISLQKLGTIRQSGTVCYTRRYPVPQNEHWKARSGYSADKQIFHLEQFWTNVRTIHWTQTGVEYDIRETLPLVTCSEIRDRASQTSVIA